MSIKVSLILSGCGPGVKRLTEELSIVPSYSRDRFPPNSIAKPYWYTEVVADCSCIETPLNTLKERILSQLENILSLCKEYSLMPTIQIIVQANYVDRPEITLSPEMICFFNQLNAEVCFDVYYD